MTQTSPAPTRRVRTTLRLPRSLYNEAREFVAQLPGESRNFNEFLVAAIRSYMNMAKRKLIDAQFARMAGDAEYQREALQLAEDFSRSDWEALEIAEADSAKS